MTLNDYIEYIDSPLSAAKARVLIVTPGESWTSLRRFYQKRGAVELHLSNLVNEDAWFPMPDVIFERVQNAMMAQAANGESLVLLGLPGYLALLTDENKRAAIFALRKWVDSVAGQEAVCLMQNVESTRLILNDVFTNPRYRQGRQLIEIDVGQGAATLASGHTEVMLVEKKLSFLIPEICESFQKYLLFTEDHPGDSSARRIVVASDGQLLPGLSAEVRQIVCLRDFARIFHDVNDTDLSEDVLQWLCEHGKDGAGKTLSETVKELFFHGSSLVKAVLHVFDKCKGVEREAVLWLVKQVAPEGSYLECITKQEGVHVGNFRSAYVTGPAEVLDDSAIYASERMDAIREATVSRFDTDIKQFIARCAKESTSRVAPWLNCGTEAEQAELLRRCAVDGFVSNIVKEVYQEVATYLNTDFVFGDDSLEEYFKEYRELKMADLVTPDFCKKAQQAVPPSSVQSRDAMVQRYAADKDCALLVVDAMGAEWLPMLVAQARQLNIGVDSIAVGEAKLPTSTKFNNIYWPDDTRRLPDIKRFDNIVHNGVEAHETRRAEENLAAALNVLSDNVLPRISDGLAQFGRVLVTADHGSSRLALLAWKAEQGLVKTLSCEAGSEVVDWRYCERALQDGCSPELEETLDGEHWVVRGYDRLPKKGGGQGFELHGGATLEERLVPVVLFSKTC